MSDSVKILHGISIIGNKIKLPYIFNLYNTLKKADANSSTFLIIWIKYIFLPKHIASRQINTLDISKQKQNTINKFKIRCRLKYNLCGIWKTIKNKFKERIINYVAFL